MDKKLRKRVDILTGYAIVSFLIFGYIAFSSFVEKDKKETLDELTVKKINVVGEDGSLRMVISNETRQHSGIINGKKIPKRQRPAGIIFFNNNGDECGGLIFNIKEKDNKTTNMMSFTMDNYHHDQAVQLVNDEEYADGKGLIQRGLVINEFPIGSDLSNALDILEIKDSVLKEQKMKAWQKEQGGKQRLFVGRNKENKTGLFLYDTNGKVRMKIYVDKSGEAKIEVLDEKGQNREVLL